ncbi:MAG: hypothetical protein WD423_05985, partial [Rhodothermales bacterium]
PGRLKPPDSLIDRLPLFHAFATEKLMGQAREKVRSFFLRYQDRILYGADISAGLVPTPYLIDMSRFDERMSAAGIAEAKSRLLQRYRTDFAYYATDLPIENGDYSVRGLALPDSVLRKVLYENAVRWVPGIDRGF